MKTISRIFFYFISAVMISGLFLKGVALSDDSNYEKIKMSFTNFVRCELTRIDAPDYFNGKPFKITMINLFDVKKEGDLLIVTGTVNCWVVNKFTMLYAAVGIKKLLGHGKVYYFLVRKKDFSVLATQLERYPYKEGCPWTQYWIDVQ